MWARYSQNRGLVRFFSHPLLLITKVYTDKNYVCFSEMIMTQNLDGHWLSCILFQHNPKKLLPYEFKLSFENNATGKRSHCIPHQCFMTLFGYYISQHGNQVFGRK